MGRRLLLMAKLDESLGAFWRQYCTVLYCTLLDSRSSSVRHSRKWPNCRARFCLANRQGKSTGHVVAWLPGCLVALKSCMCRNAAHCGAVPVLCCAVLRPTVQYRNRNSVTPSDAFPLSLAPAVEPKSKVKKATATQSGAKE